MFKYSRDGVSVLTILDTRRAKKSGMFPIKVQVVFKRKQKILLDWEGVVKRRLGKIAKSQK